MVKKFIAKFVSSETNKYYYSNLNLMYTNVFSRNQWEAAMCLQTPILGSLDILEMFRLPNLFTWGVSGFQVTKEIWMITDKKN